MIFALRQLSQPFRRYCDNVVAIQKAFFIPPKQEQAFLQGGTFVLNGQTTLLAHYDESTAAHASLDQVMEVALESAAKK